MHADLYSFVSYIDPGSGSLLFQAVIAGVLAVSVGFKQARLWLWAKLKSLVGRKAGPAAEPRESGLDA